MNVSVIMNAIGCIVTVLGGPSAVYFIYTKIKYRKNISWKKIMKKGIEDLAQKVEKINPDYIITFSGRGSIVCSLVVTELAHDDISKQQAIIDRKKSLEELLGHKFSDRDDEYLSLYALQTAYAIIVKAIAFKVVSQVRFNKSLISFGESINQDSEALRIQFSRLEDGAIFRDYGMTNLLEGDFFSWYCAENQWNESIAKCIKNIFEILSRYSEKAVLNNTHKSQDFFKRLYEAMVPAAVRHSLGEYYTRKWLAENVVDGIIILYHSHMKLKIRECQ